MANSTGSGSPTLDTINNLFGTSLEFPKCFRTPGTASLQTAFTGSAWPGSITGAASNHNPNPTGPLSTLTNGIAQVNGYQNIFGALTVTGSTLFLGGFNGKTSFWNLNSDSYSLTSTGSASITATEKIKIIAGETLNLGSKDQVQIFSSDLVGVGDGGGNVTMYGFNISACVGKKDFDIPHPTKDGWRLRHVCLEGPTADVFFKGVLNNSNSIELPEYWTGLVDYETITVNLTPILVYQELFVEKIENNKVIVKNNSGGMIRCNYLICAERKDVDKNIPEYQGEYKDYPGDNSQYLGSLLKK